MDRSEGIRKLRRKIEETIRQKFSDEKIEALATLMDIEKLPSKLKEKNEE
jgi:hypothetical protein